MLTPKWRGMRSGLIRTRMSWVRPAASASALAVLASSTDSTTSSPIPMLIARLSSSRRLAGPEKVMRSGDAPAFTARSASNRELTSKLATTGSRAVSSATLGFDFTA